MTEAEARSLREGDVVITRLAGRDREVIVDGVLDNANYPYNHFEVHVRRPGVDAAGRRYAFHRRYPSEVWSLVWHGKPQLEPQRANVYADWLEERGEYKAAAMLRKAFPLDDGKPLQPKEAV